MERISVCPSFSYCENCFSLLCPLPSQGVLINLFEIKDKLNTLPNQETHTGFSCRVVIIFGMKVLLGMYVSGLSEADGFLLQTDMSSLFSACSHKDWLLKAVKFMFVKKKKPRKK